MITIYGTMEELTIADVSSTEFEFIATKKETVMIFIEIIIGWHKDVLFSRYIRKLARSPPLIAV